MTRYTTKSIKKLKKSQVEDQKPFIQLVKEETERNKTELDATLLEAEEVLKKFKNLKNGIKA